MTEKIILTKETTVNLLNMLSSSDKDNLYLAITTIEKLDIEKSLGFIILLYKFSRVPVNVWLKSSHVFKTLKDINLINDDKDKLPTSKVLTVMMLQMCSIESIAMFLELHNESLLNTLKSRGYNTNDLKINVKLKKNVK